MVKKFRQVVVVKVPRDQNRVEGTGSKDVWAQVLTKSAASVVKRLKGLGLGLAGSDMSGVEVQVDDEQAKVELLSWKQFVEKTDGAKRERKAAVNERERQKSDPPKAVVTPLKHPPRPKKAYDVAAFFDDKTGGRETDSVVQISWTGGVAKGKWLSKFVRTNNLPHLEHAFRNLPPEIRSQFTFRDVTRETYSVEGIERCVEKLLEASKEVKKKRA